jgi:signal transduction histidine kinase
MEVLDDRPGPVSRAHVHFTSFRSCIPKLQDLLPPPPPGHRRHPRERDPAFIPPKCRAVDVTLNDGTLLKLALDSPAVAHNGILAVDPWFLTLLVLAIAVLAYIVARMASAPLQELAAAAEDRRRSAARSTAVARAARSAARRRAFNAMQHRLQRHLAERTQMLAAITHDLQTPLTRLRLRLENVSDEVLRERLIGDLAAMQALVREGLEPAAPSAEQRAALDLDSLLESIVEDTAEAAPTWSSRAAPVRC